MVEQAHRKLSQKLVSVLAREILVGRIQTTSRWVLGCETQTILQGVRRCLVDRTLVLCVFKPPQLQVCLDIQMGRDESLQDLATL